jgi:cytoskeletal protein CcmA (bactofilin family)
MALFGKKKVSKAQPSATTGSGGKGTTYLGQKLQIKGTVSGDGNVIILGELEGKFDLKGELTIAEPASVLGEIKAGLISVKGKAEGTVVAHDKLHLEPSAKVTGKVHAKTISMLEGAQLDGEMAMSSSAGTSSKKGAPS